MVAQRGYWLLVAGVALSASWLNWPVMRVGYSLDDYAQAAMLQGAYPVTRAPWDLYTFSDGSTREVAALVETGFYPWWSHPEVRLSMFRPLSSLSLALDRALFGHDALAAHLHSLFLWLAMLFAVGLLFARTLPRSIALVATLVFAVDPAQTVTLGWIANRTSILSATLCTLSLVAYLAFRRAERGRLALLAAISYTAALAAGEYALAFLGIFLACEALGSGDRLERRLGRLAWVGLPAIAYVAVRSLVGAGGRHSQVYVDPLGETGLFLQALAQRLPVVVADAVTSLRADHWSFGAPWTLPAFEAGLVDARWLMRFEPWRRVHEAIGWIAIVGVLWLIVFVARRAGRLKAGNAVWLSAGGLLATLPLVGSLPTSRLVLIPTIGLAPLFATLMAERFQRLRARDASPISRAVAGAALALVAALHLLWPPIQARAEAQLFAFVAPRARRAILAAPFGPEAASGQRAILLGSGDPNLMIYIGLLRDLLGKPAPKSLWVLSGNRFPFRLTREDERTLTLHYPPGASMLTESFEWMFRSRAEPLTRGQRFVLSAMTVELLEVDTEGLPTAMRFTFDRPLEDPSLTFWTTTVDGLAPFRPPGVGQHTDVPPPVPPIHYAEP